MTYRELERRANQLAHELRQRGVGPEGLVGLCVERSLELVIGLLGIMKAGGAFVPLDPTYPQERLAFMVQDANLRVVLTQQQFLDRLPTNDQRPTTNDQRPTTNDQRPTTTNDQRPTTTIHSPVHPFTRSPVHPFTRSPVHPTPNVICLDADWPAIAQAPDTCPGGDVSVEHVSYVVYTSGSMGRPKGTMVSGRSLLNLCLWYQAHCPITADSRVLLTISVSFDASFKNILVPLIAGGQLVLGAAGYYDPAALLRSIETQHVTVINTTPSLIYPIVELAAATHYQRLASLRYLGLGGERLDLAPLRPWLTRSPICRCRLYNVYGPTECADITTSYEVPPSLLEQHQSVPIGQPIQNMQVYVLDHAGQLQPIGVAGELCISGDGLARGYLDRPDLTAEKFIPNPFSDCRLQIADCRLGDDTPAIYNLQSTIYNSSRLYRTGDLVRWRTDGMLEYLGRIDQQVKLRGVRIELGEIAHVLEQHPAVRQACAIVREDSPANQRLVAYIVPKVEDRGLKIEDSQVDAPEMLSSILYPLSSELRAFLQRQLPNYMVPSALVVLDALPLNPNGKVDQRALPRPSEIAAPERTAAPRSDLERALVTLWCDVLKVEHVGIDDNFFDAGGHSVLAAQLHIRLQTLVGRELSLVELFKYPTIRTLAEYFSQAPVEDAPVLQEEVVQQIAEGRQRLLSQQEQRRRLLTS